MSIAAIEVDGTGTVDISNSAAERLKLNQATSATVENLNKQVSERTSSWNHPQLRPHSDMHVCEWFTLI